MKNLKPRTKVLFATAMAIFTLFSAMCASFAWFTVKNPTTGIETFTGDMNIDIDRLSAYRYVYPYYEGSNTFIDYQSEKAQVREFIIKDSQNNPFVRPDTSLREEDTKNGQYYLVGDKAFLGAKGNEYDIKTGLVLVNDGDHYVAKNVSLSKGAHFAITKNNRDFFRFQTTETDTQSIVSNDNTFFEVREPGIYDIGIDAIQQRAFVRKKTREDEAILGMTIFDPTYATFMNQEGAKAVYHQNTCLIYDVRIKVRNDTHDIGLTLTAHKNGTSLFRSPNQLNLSDFVTYRVKEENLEEQDQNDIYLKFHPTLQDENTYNTGSDSLFFQDGSSSISLLEEKIQSMEKETVRRYLIAIDYSPSTISYFFEKDRLGQEFELIRDFSFRFTSTQTIQKGEKTQ